MFAARYYGDLDRWGYAHQHHNQLEHPAFLARASAALGTPIWFYFFAFFAMFSRFFRFSEFFRMGKR